MKKGIAGATPFLLFTLRKRIFLYELIMNEKQHPIKIVMVKSGFKGTANFKDGM